MHPYFSVVEYKYERQEIMSECIKRTGQESLNARACLTANKIMFWVEGELMAAQAIQEIMDSERKQRKLPRGRHRGHRKLTDRGWKDLQSYYTTTTRCMIND
jgi:hypothetical protein